MAIGSFRDGFDVGSGASDIVLEDNESDWNVGVGFEVSAGATATVYFEDNDADDNALEFCDDAGVATAGGDNDFDVPPPAGTICIVE